MSDVIALLQPLKDRLAAATPGPWEARVDDLTDDVDVVHDQEQVSFVATCGEKRFPRALEDAEFIAHAPTDQAKLIAAIEAVLGVCTEFDEVAEASSAIAGTKSFQSNRIRAALTQALGGDTA